MCVDSQFDGSNLHQRIFINDDGEFITASVKRLGRIKIFIHTDVGLDVIIRKKTSFISAAILVKIVEVGFISPKSYAVRSS